MADRPVTRSAATLTAIAAICTALVATTYELTDERIAANDKAWLEQSLQPVLAGLRFDNSLIDSRVTIRAPHGLPGPEDALVYRAYAGGSPVAALFVVTARNGYSGAIRLLIGIRVDGTITGVHALSHRETPGLGDGIERAKSDWIEQFAGRSLADPVVGEWRIRRDGGAFDQLTGASVTSRAVTNAVRETLQYFASERAVIFSSASDLEEANAQ
jgi:electron transport complex protein RnfG